MPLQPTEALNNAVDEIAILLIRRGMIRAQELIAAAATKLNGANGHAVTDEVTTRAIEAALALSAPTTPKKPMTPRVRFLRRVDLGPIKEKLLAHIIAHPGQRSEEIMPHVRPPNVKPDAVLRALQQLSAEKWVSTTGVARGTKYSPPAKPPRIAVGSSKNLPTVLQDAMKSRPKKAEKRS